MSGRYLDLNFTIRNQGIKDSSGAKVEIYADGELVKEIESEPLDIGHGRSIFISNIFILQKSIDELRFSIKTDFEELDKENNEAILNYKN